MNKMIKKIKVIQIILIVVIKIVIIIIIMPANNLKRKIKKKKLSLTQSKIYYQEIIFMHYINNLDPNKNIFNF